MYDWKERFSVLGEKQMSILFFSVQSAAGSTLAVQQWKVLDPPFSGSSAARHSLRDWHCLPQRPEGGGGIGNGISASTLSVSERLALVFDSLGVVGLTPSGLRTDHSKPCHISWVALTCGATLPVNESFRSFIFVDYNCVWPGGWES